MPSRFDHLYTRRHGRGCCLVVLFLLLAARDAGFAQGAAEGIRDIIPVVHVEAGKADTIHVQDLFYADAYDLQFSAHEAVNAQYDAALSCVIVQSAPEFEGYTTVDFEFDSATYYMLILSKIKQQQGFQYHPEAPPRERMNIMGAFNDWNRNSLPMQDEDGDGVYEIVLELDPGQYLYQFVVDEKEIFDPNNPNKVDNGFGGYNSVVQVPPRHQNRVYLHVLDREETAEGVRLRFYYESENQSKPITADDVIALAGNLRLDEGSLEIADNKIALNLLSNSLAGEKVVRLAVVQDGQASNLQTLRLVDGLPAGQAEHGARWHDAVIYSLMVDRFYDGDSSNNHPVVHDSLADKVNYMGGDIQGIIAKLESGYFDSLGVNTLWLSPVYDNTEEALREWPAPHRFFSGYHGYWPVHHQRVEARFGNIKLLKKLVDAAHAHGMRVLLDFIANHVHQEHPFYQEHRDWFGTYELPDGRKNIRRWDEFRLTTWFEPFLPSFDFQGSAEAVEAVSDNAIWWLQQTGADGFRHDAVKHVPNRFWRTLTRKLKRHAAAQENGRLYQIGETFGSYGLISSYVNNGQLDAQFNFNLYDTAIYVFLDSAASFEILQGELEKSISVYGIDNLMGNLMDSHDKVRFMAYADGDLPLNSSDAQEIGWSNPPNVDHGASYDRARLYLAYLLTIPGLPVLYYGDEIGMTGAGDPDNRRMMRFDEQLSQPEQEMFRDVSRLIRARNEHPALRYGDFQTVLATQDCLVYLRSTPDERVLVALNKSEAVQAVTVKLPVVYGLSRAENVLSGTAAVIRDGQLRLNLSPLIGEIWSLR